MRASIFSRAQYIESATNHRAWPEILIPGFCNSGQINDGFPWSEIPILYTDYQRYIWFLGLGKLEWCVDERKKDSYYK